MTSYDKFQKRIKELERVADKDCFSCNGTGIGISGAINTPCVCVIAKLTPMLEGPE